MRLESYAIAAAPPGIRLLFESPDHPEGSWDWFEILTATTLAEGEEAVILALMDGEGRAVAAIPVVSMGGRVIRGLTSPFTTLFLPPLGGDDTARMLGRFLAAKAGGLLRLDGLGGGAAQALQEGLAAGGMVTARFRHFANWFEEIGDFSRYWNGRGSRLKATVKRKGAALQRASALEFEQVNLITDWRRGAEIYNGIYAKSWKPAEPHPHFVDTLLERLGPGGTAKLAIASIDGKPVAAQIWMVRDTVATIFKLAHDPKFDRQSPGTLLTHWFLRELHEKDGIRHVDFGRGDDVYKREWLHHCRDRLGILAANPRSVRGFLTIVFDILPSKLGRFLRRTGEARINSDRAA
ncbi:MAG TPA: GNAT family N-acetyltransferase [Rhizomicrobium sp.]|nr:GNAT family N-acetyltransferase [Rhizomicrobium sp.]